jgi:hypothetical protein
MLTAIRASLGDAISLNPQPLPPKAVQAYVDDFCGTKPPGPRPHFDLGKFQRFVLPQLQLFR